MSIHAFNIKQTTKQIYNFTKQLAEEKNDKFTSDSLIKELKSLVFSASIQQQAKTDAEKYDIATKIAARIILLMCLNSPVYVGKQKS